MERALRSLLWLLTILLALKLRLTVVTEFQAPAGDGIQYYQLSQVLKSEHRFSYQPAPSPPTWTRLPGYPLFLALTQPARPLTLREHLIAATRLNALLDVGTALLIAALSAQLGMGALAQLLGFWAVIFMPTLLMLSAFGLCESLVTFLLTLAVYLALLGKSLRPPWRWVTVAGCGMVVGLAQLVRVDTVLVLPALLMLLVLTTDSWRGRVQNCLLCLGLAALVFAPWPLRNLRLFGAAHVGGSPWIDAAGVPLRLGMMRWYQTWATGRKDGEGFDLFLVARHSPLPPARPNVITPVMFEDAREQQELAALFEQYCHEGLSPAVDKKFYSLAWKRLKRHPFRVLVELPLVRLRTLWSPMPDYELSITSTLLRLPKERKSWDRLGSLLLLLSVAGACFALSEPTKRRWVLALLLVPVARSVGFAYLHPIPLQRYFVEAIPVLMLFSGYALAWPVSRLSALLSRGRGVRSGASEPSL